MKRVLLLSLLFGSLAALNAASITYHVTVDSSGIPAATAGFVEFQFNQANALTSLSATASITNFSSNGFTFDNVATNFQGGVTGSLAAPPLVFDNTGGGANVFDQGVAVFGSGFVFDVTFSGAALTSPSTDGSEFFVLLLDTSYNPLVNPQLGGEAATILLNGDTTITPNPTSISTIAFIPEPSTWLTGLAGLLLLGCRCRR